MRCGHILRLPGTSHLRPGECYLLLIVRCSLDLSSILVLQCPSGYYSASDGLPGCLACPQGSYAATNGSSDCDLCPPGSSQPLTGKTSCTLCDRGKVSSV